MDPKNTRLRQNNLSQEVHAGVCSLAQTEATETIVAVEDVQLCATPLLRRHTGIIIWNNGKCVKL